MHCKETIIQVFTQVFWASNDDNDSEGGGGDNWAVKLLSRVTKCTNHITHFTTKEVNISFRQFMLNRFKYTSRYTTSTKYYIASLLFVILAKMMLGFGLAVMALVLCVAVAGFHYFGHVINLYRGLKGQPTDNPRPQRKRRRGKRRGRGRQIRGTDQSISENITANLPLRQRPRPQENDEPLWYRR